METRIMFWTIAGLIFVSMIILVGMTLAGQMMKLQTCGAEDVYEAGSKDNRGTECGEDLYCNYADVSEKGAGTYRERDACVDIEKHLCCRKCYQAVGTYEGDPCGYPPEDTKQEHPYKCFSSLTIKNKDGLDTPITKDACTNEEAHRCCRDWA